MDCKVPKPAIPCVCAPNDNRIDQQVSVNVGFLQSRGFVYRQFSVWKCQTPEVFTNVKEGYVSGLLFEYSELHSLWFRHDYVGPNVRAPG